ncbi:hypothetical protein, partial [Litorimonas sp.]|uniref:hypothetical protein n=1 Tax=Litorimonas sp. TaxID=1892381 RepID=UPI003A85767A
LQGRCDKTAAAGLGPCETLPNSVSGKDTDPAGSPLYSRTNAKADPQMGSGTKGVSNYEISITSCHTDATLGSPGISALSVQRKTSSTDQDAKHKALAPGRLRLRRCD